MTAVSRKSTRSTFVLLSVEEATAQGNTAEKYRFDVRTGKSPDPPQIDPDCNWSLSPDGSEKTSDPVVKGWNELMGVGWSADGKSLLVSWHDFERDSALLNVSLDGKATVLLESSNPEIWHAVPSPNGRMLAIAEAGDPTNVWQIENF